MKKTTIIWIFAVIILMILLVTMTILGITGFLFSLPNARFDTDLKLGESVIVSVKPNEASVCSLSFDGAYLTGERLPQKIQINAETLTEDVFLRVKSTIFGCDQQLTMDFVVSSNFTLEDDGYYYYNNTLAGGDKTTFCEYIIVPENQSCKTDKKYIFTLIVECLSADEDINRIWKIN